MINKSFYKALIAWDEQENKFYKLFNNNFMKISDLHHIEKQKKIIYQNTILFSKGQLSNNALLWGARGTGKSSLIHAIFKEIIKNHNISLLELRKNQIKYFSSILRKLTKS